MIRPVLEQKYAPGLVLYEVMLEPEHPREMKYCEAPGCGKLFIRTYTVEEIDGLRRRTGVVYCPSCRSKPFLNLPINREAEDSFKEERLKYRRAGAPHPVEVTEKKIKKGWRDPLIAEFQRKGLLTRIDIAQIVGWNDPSIVGYVRGMGLPIITERYVREEGKKGRGYALYRLDVR